MKTAYLSLGSNLGDRQANLRRALDLLTSPEIHIRRESSLYETEPQGLRNQPWFLNMVAEIETTLFPRQLLARIRRVERDLHRKRLVLNGPRTIDIDILLYANAIIDAADLQIPHPRMSTRRFVLEPLAELAPNLRHPVTRRQFRDLLADTTSQAVNRVH